MNNKNLDSGYYGRCFSNNFTDLFKPVNVAPIVKNSPNRIKIDQGRLNKKLELFRSTTNIMKLASQHKIDSVLFPQVYNSFKKFIKESTQLPDDINIIIDEILLEKCHVDSLFPYFLSHAKQMFPHLDCMEDLLIVADLTKPSSWYSEARKIKRKIIYHAGPTNSGKTHNALKKLYDSESGVYCAPLRLLANEIYRKMNSNKINCDLITGEERLFANTDSVESKHISCTVEMTNLLCQYDVAIIDEIQMISDPGRGWAWTRVFLGLCAQELHVCGDESAINLIKSLTIDCGDEFEVHTYKRLTPLKIDKKALVSLANVQPGDCIVCFSKSDIYKVNVELEKLKTKNCVIYGTLPPGTKYAQSLKFNESNDYNIMVATDAIGMGINLYINNYIRNIKRIIFYSLLKPNINTKGETDIEQLTPSVAKQISGRAGRFRSDHKIGYVTTFHQSHLLDLIELLSLNIEPLEKAGIQPTAEQIEMFAYHLPNLTLSNIFDIFLKMSKTDNEKFFMCRADDFKYIADLLEHLPLDLKSRYQFCRSPISKKQQFVCNSLLKMARRFSKNEIISYEWLKTQINWPFYVPESLHDLNVLENVYDVLDLYLWLSCRFPSHFCDSYDVKLIRTELDSVINAGINNLSSFFSKSENLLKTRFNKMKYAKFSETNFRNQLKVTDQKIPPIKNNQSVMEYIVKYNLLTPHILSKLQNEITNKINLALNSRKKH
ncbi:hypothetical protein A3Q56_05920 [Intoshia linei]|uniref:RNA helicase n=1 Tax=Intoshia linei TaxID=1819745 RepID=A0A177AY75_9BILA|nr:hypothetical protein A3Q56_05920 [Intoshia linei]